MNCRVFYNKACLKHKFSLDSHDIYNVYTIYSCYKVINVFYNFQRNEILFKVIISNFSLASKVI
jgi:hypothetical protein